MIANLAHAANYIGTLRTMLGILVLVVAGMAPWASEPTAFTGWVLITTVVAPAFFAMLLFVLPLDVMMTLIFMSDREGKAKQRLKRIAVLESVLLLLLIGAWLPLVLQLLQIS